MTTTTYLTTEELASRIKYTERTIRGQLIGKCLFEGRHFVRAFGGRKLLFKWEQVEKDMCRSQSTSELMAGIQ